MAATAPLSSAAVDRLRRALDGQVVVPGDPRYDDARRVWNGAIDRRPAAVAYCTSADDVATALVSAREHDRLVAVRCGGHSVAGLSTCDGGIVIDLSGLRGVEVDPVRRVARVQGGSLLRELDAAAQAHGLACPTGVVGHTGVGGLTLGGGLGRLTRAHGASVDNVLAVELVTVDGALVRASEEENPELFWGMRGAGANFGIVTAFELRLHEIGTTMLAGSLLYPIERASEVGAVFDDWASQAPRTVVALLNVGRLPTGSDLPADLAGRPAVVVGAAVTGPTAAAEEALRPLRDLGPALDTLRVTPYLELQGSEDEVLAWGRRYYWKGLLLDRLPAAAVDAAVAHVVDSDGVDGVVGAMTLGGAFADVDEDAMAFSGRGARYWQSVEVGWTEPADDERNVAWARGASAALRPFASGRNYANDLAEPGADGVRSAYGAEKHDRLVALKRAWDPDNVLRLNQNIAP